MTEEEKLEELRKRVRIAEEIYDAEPSQEHVEAYRQALNELVDYRKGHFHSSGVCGNVSLGLPDGINWLSPANS